MSSMKGLVMLLLASLASTAVLAVAPAPAPAMFAFPPYKSFPKISPSTDVNITATHKAIVTPPVAAEYHCYDGNRVFVIAGSNVSLADNQVSVYELNESLALTSVGRLDLILPGESEAFGEPNSCTAFNGRVYVVVTPFRAIGNAVGKLMVYDATTLELISNYATGYNPDHVKESPNKRFVVTADEGEPPQTTPSPTTNQRGGATVLDTQTGNTCSFQFDFSGISDAEFAANRVHQSLKEVSMSVDIEPEFVSFDPQSNTRAYLTCQEASAIVVIDINPDTPCTSEARVISIRALGWKDYRSAFPNNTIAASDRAGLTGGTAYNINNLFFRNSPLYGSYQPDGTKGFAVGGVTYFITANEGDSKDRDFFGTRDEALVADLTGPNFLRSFNGSVDWSPLTNATLTVANNLGRLIILSQEGLSPENPSMYNSLVAQGGRGFAIWRFEDSQTTLVYESGDSTELELQAFFIAQPTLIDQRAAFLDRTRRKGSEPENTITFVTPGGRTIAVVGFERASCIGFYDVSNPAAPKSIGYVSHPQLFGPEGISVIPPADSPNGKFLLIVNGEGAGAGTHRLMVWELDISEPTAAPTVRPTSRPTNATAVPTRSSSSFTDIGHLAAAVIAMAGLAMAF